MSVCATCSEPLLLEVEPDSDVDEQNDSGSSDSVPDDVELRCGCHFHWECLLEAYTITECPSCAKTVSSLSPDGETQVLCTVKNEGGTQEDSDILPSAKEEAYLRCYPEERTAYAFLTFCREGDLDAIIHLLKDSESDDAAAEDKNVDLLRYKGSFEAIDGTGLHVAIRDKQQEVAWLMLALGSTLSWEEFPVEVLQALKKAGLGKEDRQAEPDMRTLEDSRGRSPAALAKEVGGWGAWLGRLTPG